MTNRCSPTWVDYRAAVTRFIDGVDAVLTHGRTAQTRYDQFCSQHGIRSDSSHEKLLGNSVPPGDRHVHQRLLGLTENLYAQVLGPTRAQRPTLTRTAPRALGSRNRI